MKKKLLSLLLSLSLCASLLPAALAEEEESYSPPPQKVYDPDTMRWGLDTYVEGEGVVTILPKESMYFSGLQLKTHVLQGFDAGEGFTDSFHFK